MPRHLGVSVGPGEEQPECRRTLMRTRALGREWGVRCRNAGSVDGQVSVRTAAISSPVFQGNDLRVRLALQIWQFRCSAGNVKVWSVSLIRGLFTLVFLRSFTRSIRQFGKGECQRDG